MHVRYAPLLLLKPGTFFLAEVRILDCTLVSFLCCYKLCWCLCVNLPFLRHDQFEEGEESERPKVDGEASGQHNVGICGAMQC